MEETPVKEKNRKNEKRIKSGELWYKMSKLEKCKKFKNWIGHVCTINVPSCSCQHANFFTTVDSYCLKLQR